jgi:hypothetical protein
MAMPDPLLTQKDVRTVSFLLLKEAFRLIDLIAFGLSKTLARRWSRFILFDNPDDPTPGFSFLKDNRNLYDDVGIGPFLELLSVSRTTKPSDPVRKAERQLLHDHEFDDWKTNIEALERIISCLIVIYFSGRNCQPDMKIEDFLISNTEKSPRSLTIQNSPNHAVLINSQKVPWLLGELLMRQIFLINPIRTYISAIENTTDGEYLLSPQLFETSFSIQEDFIESAIYGLASHTHITSIQQWHAACEQLQAEMGDNYLKEWTKLAFGDDKFNYNLYVHKMDRVSLLPIIGSWDIIPTPSLFAT